MIDAELTASIDALEVKRKEIQKGKDVMEYIKDKKYNSLSLEIYTLDCMRDMMKLPRGTKLYCVEKKFRSDYSGNHGSYDVYYIEDQDLVRVWMPVHMKKQREGGYMWVRHGGNYGFTFDIVNEIGTILHDDGYYFKESNL